MSTMQASSARSGRIHEQRDVEGGATKGVDGGGRATVSQDDWAVISYSDSVRSEASLGATEEGDGGGRPTAVDPEMDGAG